jgi:hypothetical protein
VCDHAEHLARRPVAAELVAAFLLYAPVYRPDLVTAIADRLAEMEARSERMYVAEGVMLVLGLGRYGLPGEARRPRDAA